MDLGSDMLYKILHLVGYGVCERLSYRARCDANRGLSCALWISFCLERTEKINIKTYFLNMMIFFLDLCILIS